MGPGAGGGGAEHGAGRRFPLVRLRGVSHDYRGPVAALRGVDLELAPGEFLAVAGANGSGKSTLALVLSGILRPSRGEVRVDGAAPDSSQPFRGAAAVFQNPENCFVAPTLEEDTAFGPENAGREPAEIRRLVDAALARVGLTGLEGRHPATLSGGQRQLAALAGALATQPRLLVLDEASSHLDAPRRGVVLDIVRGLHREGLTVVLVSQEPDELWAAERLVVLAGGRVAWEGPPSGLLLDPETCASLGVEPDPLAGLAACLRRRGVEIPPGRPTPALFEAIRARRGA